MGIHVLWISVFNYYPCFYGYPFGYPWISMDIHALTCYGFSIQGRGTFVRVSSAVSRRISQICGSLVKVIRTLSSSVSFNIVLLILRNAENYAKSQWQIFMVKLMLWSWRYVKRPRFLSLYILCTYVCLFR